MILVDLGLQAAAIRSFIIAIYDENLKELCHYQVPISVAAPFGNRLFKEALKLPIGGSTLREPWYSLAPCYAKTFQRSAEPVGPTSLYGKAFDPGQEITPAIKMHPDAKVYSFVVRLYDYQTELFRGEYSVDDIFLHGVSYLLNHAINKETATGQETYYYQVIPSKYAVRSVDADIMPEAAYQVEGVFRLPPRVKDEPRIQFKPVAEPTLPERDPADFGASLSHGKGEPQSGHVYIPARLYQELRSNLTLSQKNEEGGYVLGNVFRMPGSPEKEDDPNFRWLVEVTDLLMAEDTVGTAITLLFTGDTWSKVSRRRDREFAERKLAGWFHTHVFPASDSFGLSGLDQEMHAWYLPKPWQVAILLNLENDGERTVRCYQRGQEGDLVETPFTVFAADN